MGAGSGTDVPTPRDAVASFTIEDDLDLAEGGPVAKFNRNLAAIGVLKELERESRAPTADEQRVLAQYVGWGGLPQAFNEAVEGKWQDRYQALKEVLTEDEYRAARQSTQNAHYTAVPIIDAMYAIARRLGFTGGNILEAGSGVGNFVGRLPQSLSARFTMVERDSISARIAKQLYGRKHNVQQADFTTFSPAPDGDGQFSMAIGNPPFAANAMFDQSGRRHLTGLSTHNYFVAKSIDMLHPGGILIQVVSHGFMDAAGTRAREMISEKAQFVGAIRLPNDAFEKNAMTSVTTDIVIFRKFTPAEMADEQLIRDNAKLFVGTTDVRDDRFTGDIQTNVWFANNPEMMLGSWGFHGKLYGGVGPGLKSTAGDLSEKLAAAAKTLPQYVFIPAANATTAPASAAPAADVPVEPGGFYTVDGRLFQRLRDDAGERRAREVTAQTLWTPKKTLGQARFEQLRALADFRAALRSLLVADRASAPDLTARRQRLSEAYDAYVGKYGYFHDSKTSQVFHEDPDYPHLLALEVNYDPGVSETAAKKLGVPAVAPSASKSDIFRKRVNEDRPAVETAETPEEAVLISLAERGRVDAEYVGKLLGKDPAGLLDALAREESPVVFADPTTGEYVSAGEYLSGDVRAKLRAAEKAGATRNADALRKVLPPDVSAKHIEVHLGSAWVPMEVYEDFAREVFGPTGTVRVFLSQLLNSFTVQMSGVNPAAQDLVGTPEVSGRDIFEKALNRESVKLTARTSSGATVVLQEETDAANEKILALQDRFDGWVFSDPERAQLVTRAFNDKRNNFVRRVFSGDALRLIGKSTAVKLRKHQLAFIARVVQTRTALADHVVGAGKTYAAIASGMELRRLGLARKPMYVVPNHLVSQWGGDILRLYPNAKVLVTREKDFEGANRRELFAKIAHNDWDAVIIGHSQSSFIKMPTEFEIGTINAMLSDVRAALKEAQAVADAAPSDDGARSGRRGRASKTRAVKQLEGKLERLEARIARLRSKPRDGLINFEEMGVDQLFVDEAHMFKNLMYMTRRQNVRYMGDSNGSMRAFDMLLKVRSVQARNGNDRGVVFLTGTPVSNTLSELFHMMNYLMPSALKSNGLASFDAWADTFGLIGPKLVATPAGGYKEVTAFSEFTNLEQLMALYDQVGDTVTLEQIKTDFQAREGKPFPIPNVKGGRRRPVVSTWGPAGLAYQEQILQRLRILEARKRPARKGEDNILSVMSDARKAALDPRLANPGLLKAPDTAGLEVGGKLDLAANEIIARYQQWGAVKGAQLVFSDLGIPKIEAATEAAEYDELLAKVKLGDDPETQLRAEAGDSAAQAVLAAAEAAQEALDKKGPDWVAAIEAAKLGFSIYDELKATLVARGIPAAEIAFIHDAKNTEAKKVLFARVRSGAVRVLIGSTEKMGAGMNVQERLVALHHLDVPWRPSDVEQREGRIIRQGNELHAADPGFEVEILAYVTTGSLDKVMWNTQERKLLGINQLRNRKFNYDEEFNPFDELEMSAAEMQAAATEDARFVRVIVLENDIKKLERKRRAYQSDQSDREAQIRRLRRDIDALPGMVANAERMEAAAKVEAKAIADRESSVTAEIDGTPVIGRANIAAIVTERVDAKVPNDKGVMVAAPLDVTFNGERFTARDKLTAAVVRAVGIRGFPEVQFNGTTYTQPRRLAEVVLNRALDTRASGTFTAQVGVASKLQFEVSEGKLEVAASIGDSRPLTVDVLKIGDARREEDAQALMHSFNWLAGKIAAASATRVSAELARDLVRAQSALDTFIKAGELGAWPGQANLDALRAEHKVLTDQLAAEANAKVAAQAAIDEAARAAQPPPPTYYSLPVGDGRGGPVGVGVDTLTPVAERIGRKFGVTIRVVRNDSDPSVPAAVRGQRPDAQGMTDGQTVWLFADNLHDMDHALSVIAHEVVGHVGMEGILGETEWTQVQVTVGQIAAGATSASPELQAVVAEVQRAYAGASLETQAKEVLAVMAERGITASWFDQVVAAFRRFWRKINPRLVLSEAELRSLIRASERDLQRRARAVDPGPDAGLEQWLSADDAMLTETDSYEGVNYSVNLTASGRKLLKSVSKAAAKYSTKAALLRKFQSLVASARPTFLKTTPLLYLQDLTVAGMTAVREYRDLKLDMDAMRERLHQNMHTVVMKWQTAIWQHGYAAGAALSDLMHESSIAGVDPTRSQNFYRTAANRLKWAQFKAQFDALHPDLQALYVEVREAYSQRMGEMRAAMIQNVTDADTAQRAAADSALNVRLNALKARQATMTAADYQLAESKLRAEHARRMAAIQKATTAKTDAMKKLNKTLSPRGPYFPLMRFGDFFVIRRDAATGKLLSFSTFETLEEAKDARDEMEASDRSNQLSVNYEDGALRKDDGAMRNDIAPEFMAELDRVLASNQVSDQLRDEIYQSYLRTLPDYNYRKSFIHRKGVAGYSKDALRAFAKNMFHSGHQIARMTYGQNLSRLIRKAQSQAETLDPYNGVQIVNELKGRHAFIMNPTGSAFAQYLTSFGFVYHLGFNPAHFFLNPLQTVIMGVPLIGSRFGFGATLTEMRKVSGSFARGGFHTENDPALPAEEVAALKRAIRSGLILKGQGHSLAGVGDHGADYSPLFEDFMAKAGWIFHQTERFNREVTFVTAFRLARRAEPNKSFDAVFDEARKLTELTHFNYNSTDRPPLFQGDWARVFLLFRYHTFNVLYRLGTDIATVFSSQSTPELKKQTLRQLGAMMGMFFAFAGTLGIPGIGTLLFLLSMLRDDDEPFSVAEELIFGMRQHVLGNILLDGFAGSATGITLSERLGMPNLFFRDESVDLKGREAADAILVQLAGPIYGAARNVYTGVEQVGDGEIQKGLETMAPAALRNPMRAFRQWQEEGVTSSKGDVLVEVNAWNLLTQSIGFTAAKTARAYERRSLVGNAQSRLNERWGELLDQLVKAEMRNDGEAMRATYEELQAYIKANPGERKNFRDVALGRRSRMRNNARTEGGVIINPRTDYLLRRIEGEP